MLLLRLLLLMMFLLPRFLLLLLYVLVYICFCVNARCMLICLCCCWLFNCQRIVQHLCLQQRRVCAPCQLRLQQNLITGCGCHCCCWWWWWQNLDSRWLLLLLLVLPKHTSSSSMLAWHTLLGLWRTGPWQQQCSPAGACRAAQVSSRAPRTS
jgi:hypothetical protein